MANVPTNLIPSRITSLPEAPVADPAGYFPIVISGTTYKVQFSQIQGNVEVPASRQIIAGTGLTGGGTLSQNITIAVANGGIGNDQLDTTGVAAGSYGTGSLIPVVTVNTKGRVTSISTTSVIVTGYVSDNIQVIAGTGLTGGGTLTQNRTLAIDYAATTPSSLGTASAGSAPTPARIDHVHPALNLSDSTQTSGALPMGRGGTGTALSPIAGAIVYSTGSQFAIGSPGSVGQVLVSGGAGAYTWGSVQLITPVAANTMFAGPTSGGNADPSFRALVNADIPATLNGKTIESATITNALSLTAVSGNITTLTSSSGTITNLTGTSGTIDTLAGTSWTVTNLTATSATISNFTFTSSTVTDLTATRLTATSAHITTLSSGSATLTNLTSTSGTVSTLKSTSADITNVSATSLTLSSALKVGSGGTGLSLTPTNGQLLIGNGNGYTLASLTAGTGVSVTNATGSITLANTAPDQTVTVTSGTNISVTGTYPSFTVSSPDTVVGPAGATSGAIALYDGGTGKLVKNSAITINASGVISNVNTPNTGTDAANKQYVDDLVSTGIHIHTPVVLATSPGSSRTDTYNNGTAGVSATLTSVANGTLVIDGTVASATIRVLIQDCSNPIGNGVYVVTNAGSAAAQYVMTRSSDADTAGQQSTQSLDDGSYFFTTGGTSNKGASWVNTNTGNISFGSTAITFSQFSASQVYSAGNGLSLTATTFSLDTPVSVLNGGVGLSSAPTNGQLLIGNGAGYTLAGLTAGTGVSVTNATGSITLANTAPDQTVIITGSGIVSVTGTYPSFTVGAVETYSGTVTSVDGSSTVSGFTLSGGPITTSGRLTLAGTLAISNGGTGASTQSGARTALGLGTMATQDASSVVITGGSIGSSVLVNLTNATGNISGGTY